VDHAEAQHALHLPDQERVPLARLLRRRCHVVEAQRRMAFGIGDQLHDQHALVDAVRLRHADAGAGQAVERLDLGVLPVRFLLAPAVAAAIAHGALVAAVA
jgi:hypothetical protein